MEDEIAALNARRTMLKKYAEDSVKAETQSTDGQAQESVA